MEFLKSMMVSASGLRAQTQRMKVIAENLANASSTAKTADGDPYRRKVVTFSNELDRSLGATKVKVNKIGTDKSEFQLRYEPGHPGANADGYIKLPNVMPLIEMADMQEAHRTYEANLGIIEGAKSMLQRTIDLLR
jgi:flagellar basal-body rod protein FlgC